MKLQLKNKNYKLKALSTRQPKTLRPYFLKALRTCFPKSSSTRQLVTLSTQALKSSSTRQLVTLSPQALKSSLTRQLVNSLTRQLLALLTCSLVFCSCDRRDITYYMEAELGILAEWHASGLEEEEAGFGATAVFFTHDTPESRHVLMGTREADVVRLPEGTYHAILFNRSPDGFSSIRFSGDTFEEYTAAARQVETRTDPDTRVTTRVIISTPEDLAADVVTGIEVTEAMLGNYGNSDVMALRSRGGVKTEENTRGIYPLVNFLPQKLTRKVKVEIHFEGINNIRSTVARIDGVSESIQLSTATPSPTTAIQQFSMDGITYDPGSPFNGTLTGEFNVFGFDLENEHTIWLDMLLVDNKTRVEQPLQAKARTVEGEEGADYETVIYINVASPEKLPEVKPEGDPDSGFNADVEEWGDPVEEEIPLN